LDQAVALEKLLQEEKTTLTAAVHYALSAEQATTRLSGRRICPACKTSFHLDTLPPRQEGICDHCGARLVQREDDRPEAIRVRMRAYEESAAPLLAFYQKQGLLISIPADRSPAETCQRTIEALPEPGLAVSERVLADYPAA
jgi:adenylate kinase